MGKKAELKFTYRDSGIRLTESEVAEVRDIMTTIIARYIVKNKIDIYKKKDIEKQEIQS